MATLAQANQHRRDLAVLTGLAVSDLRASWGRFNTAEAARDMLRDLMPRLTVLYGAAAATLAADWYDEVRDGDRVRGRFRAVPADVDTAGADQLARWGVGPLFSDTPDPGRALTLLEGGLQRRVANASRATITGSAVADPAATGWQRVGSGECGFCAMLIGRGAVYSQATADFGAHDHCNCSAVPAFGGQPAPVRPYTPSTTTASDADRVRVREWLAANT